MSLDSRVRSAVDETLRASLDVDQGLQALRRTRRRRSAGRIAASAAVVALVLAGVLVDRHDSRPEPAPTPGQVRNGVMFATSPGRLLAPVVGERLPGVPLTVDDAGPLSFSADGHRVFYAQDRIVYASDVDTGERTPLAGCPDKVCVAAVAGDGDEVAFGRRGRIEVHPLSSSAPIVDFRVPGPLRAPVWAPVWAPDQRRIAFLGGEYGRRGPWLSVLDTRTGSVRRLARVGLTSGEQPAWSPNGKTIAYVQHRVGEQYAPVELMTVPADGGTPRLVHELGECCIRDYPAIAWSPDGRLLAATYHPPKSHYVGGPVYTVRPDGTGWRLLLRGLYDSRLAWQPVLTERD